MSPITSRQFHHGLKLESLSIPMVNTAMILRADSYEEHAEQ
jgi:hypothetical protein